MHSFVSFINFVKNKNNMKKLKYIVLMMFLTGIMLSFSSCLVTRRHDNGRHDNGRHLGWFKKNNNHHHDKGRTIRVITYDKHKQPSSKSSSSKQYKSSKSKK